MVIILLADGFEELEAVAPADILRRMGVEVVLAGVNSKTVRGSHGIELTADKTLSRLVNETPEMVILPGGMPGAKNLEATAAVKDIVARTADAGGYVAAICAAPMVLGKMGLLKGRRAVCYPGYEEFLEGAQPGTGSVEVDGNIITANGPGAAIEFSYVLGKLLKGEVPAKFTLKSMLAGVG